jgi:hypothetical protein
MDGNGNGDVPGKSRREQCILPNLVIQLAQVILRYLLKYIIFLRGSLACFVMPGLKSHLGRCQTAFADAIQTDLHVVNLTGKNALKGMQVHGDAFRVQAVNLAALTAVKVGVALVKGVGGQAEKIGATAADALHEALFHKIVQDAVNSDLVDGLVAVHGGEDLFGAQRGGVVANNFQNPQAMGCGAQARLG